MPAYNIRGHGAMIADAGRVEAFSSALRHRIQPGQTVLDIGTGTGIWAFVACRLGARKVYAIEPDEIIHRAKKAAIANGFADRIEFIQDLSTRIELPERVDGIVADIRGALPPFNGSLATLIDARTRFLEPGGWIVPGCDTLWVALVSDPDGYKNSIALWDSRPLDFDFSEFRLPASVEWGNGRIAPERLISAPARWVTIDYATLSDPRVRGTASWRIERPGVAHGLCVWFDMEDPGGRFSNSPLSGETHVYSRPFLPWTRPVELAVGDTVSVELMADPIGSEYLWRWNASVGNTHGSTREELRQSMLDGSQLPVESLRRRAHAHRPHLNTEGEIDRLIIDRFGDGSTLEGIAREVTARFPGRFPTWQKALTRVGELSAQYSK